VNQPAQDQNAPTGPDTNTQGLGFDLAALLRPILKHWVTIVCIALVVAVGVGFWTNKQVRIYEASATVQFDPTPPRPLGGKVESVVEVGTNAFWDTREYYETQYQIIQSRRVSTVVVHQLGLTSDFAFLLNLPHGVDPPPGLDPVSEEDAADALRARIRVDPVKNSRIATVRLTDADPERATLILRAVVEAYRELNVDTVVESTDEAAQWLRVEQDKLKGELESNEMELHEYKTRNNILSVEYDDKSNMLREQIGQLNQLLTTIRTHRIEIASRRNQLAKVTAKDPNSLPATELLDNQLLNTLRQQYVSASTERDALLRGGLGANHPDVEQATSKAESAKVALLAEVKNTQGALDGDLGAITSQEAGVAELFERSKKDALDLNLLEIEYNRLRRSKDNTEKLYSLLLERSKESDLTRRLRINNVTVIDMPVVPKGPISPNVPFNVTLGLLGGLALGVGAAFGRFALDRTVKTAEDVEQFAGTFIGLIPEIGAADSAKRRRRDGLIGGPELIVHDAPTSGIAEAARSIRTNLLFMAPDKPYHVLLVTSAGPSEGKTTVACCIATAIAQTGKRVLLIDCDLRRPRIHRVFRQDRHSMGPGLTAALLKDSDEDPVVETAVPNLSIIPAGPIPPNPSELLHSERFKAFLKTMSARFDQVIIDSPPLVAVTDATILSTLVDGTVMVIRAFKTRKDLASHARRLLSDVDANVAGVVLNAVNLDRNEYKYVYQYYRRGSYYATDQDASRGTNHSSGPGLGPSPLE
jgi:capsular exopolysaccharide synthesis family protein